LGGIRCRAGYIYGYYTPGKQSKKFGEGIADDVVKSCRNTTRVLKDQHILALVQVLPTIQIPQDRLETTAVEAGCHICSMVGCRM
jgi:hypothetical protein